MTRKLPVADQRAKSAASHSELSTNGPVPEDYVDEVYGDFQSALTANVRGNAPDAKLPMLDSESKVTVERVHEALQVVIEKVRNDAQRSFDGKRAPEGISQPLLGLSDNVQRSVEALGSAMAEMPSPVSPQLARSAAATERAWRDLESEFGLLTSIEVSTLLGSDPPNRTYASHQRAQGKLIAVKRPKGLRYPGFQFNATEPAILPVMEKLIAVAENAGRSEASLALWMTRPTGYLDGDRPVDWFSEPDKVIQAAKQSFGVQW